jgi:hypothetical protein
MKVTVCDPMTCSLVDIYERFGGICCFHLYERPKNGYGPEDGGNMFLRISK